MNNVSANILDLSFAKYADVDVNDCCPLPKLDVYYPAFTVAIGAVQCAVSLKGKYCYRGFRNANYDEINSFRHQLALGAPGS